MTFLVFLPLWTKIVLTITSTLTLQLGPYTWRHPCPSLPLLLGSETRSTAVLLPIVRQKWAPFFPSFTKPGVEWENTTEAGVEYLILSSPGNLGLFGPIISLFVLYKKSSRGLLMAMSSWARFIKANCTNARTPKYWYTNENTPTCSGLVPRLQYFKTEQRKKVLAPCVTLSTISFRRK